MTNTNNQTGTAAGEMCECKHRQDRHTGMGGGCLSCWDEKSSCDRYRPAARPASQSVPIGELLWGKETHEGESLYSLLQTIEHLDEDESSVQFEHADDPTPIPMSVRTLKLLASKYKSLAAIDHAATDGKE